MYLLRQAEQGPRRFRQELLTEVHKEGDSMAKKKKYNKVQGTKDFLILTIVCAVLCVWAVRDGWFPSNKVLKKHPPELILAFETDGVVVSVDTKEGASVREGAVLAKLATAAFEDELKALEAAYAAARDAAQEQIAAEKYQAILAVREKMRASTLKVALGYKIELDENRVPQITGTVWSDDDPDYKKCYLLKEKMMVVKKIVAKRNRRVSAGEPAIIVNTKDHFYPFNKVLAFITGIGILVFGIMHMLASKD